MAPRPVPRLELSDVTKAYGPLVAVDGVSLAVAPGEVHAVLGENGAGKSTLMKILYGVVQADAGRVLWDGEPVAITTPTAARRLGIGMVFQHFSLFPSLTVLENLVVSLPAGRSAAAIATAAEALAGQHGLAVDLRRTVDTLSVGERQRVEIVRCLLQDPRLIILDEPTSVLTPQAVEELFALLRALAGSGCSILYVSHKLHEVRALCDSATILRRGRVVDRVDPRGETDASLAERMLGSVVPPPSRRVGAATPRDRLAVRGLDRPAETAHGVALRDVDLTVRAGEILGIAGIAGNGQAELLEAISGEWRGPAEAVMIEGAPAGALGPVERRRLGLVAIPEERLGHGAVPSMTLADNALLTTAHRGLVRHGLIDRRAAAAEATRCIRDFDVRSGTPRTTAQALSGGNLQKFIVGRELSQAPGVVVAHQPTWGIDVGAAAAIYTALAAMRDAGAAILLVSEDLDELFAVCDRIAVLSAGRLSPPVPIGEATVEAIGRLMADGSHHPSPAAGVSHAVHA
jgi:simple sugar transport system ATP-binding protein